MLIDALEKKIQHLTYRNKNMLMPRQTEDHFISQEYEQSAEVTRGRIISASDTFQKPITN